MGSTVGRVAAGVLTGGISELVRATMSPPKVSSPSVPEPPKAPTTQMEAVQDASAQVAQRRNKSQGFRSTILQKLSPTPLKETIGA